MFWKCQKDVSWQGDGAKVDLFWVTERDIEAENAALVENWSCLLVDLFGDSEDGETGEGRVTPK